MDKLTLFVEDIGDERHDAVDLLPAVGKTFQKHNHVVVGVLARLAARSRAEQHHPLDAVAIQSSSAARKRFRIGSAEGKAGI